MLRKLAMSVATALALIAYPVAGNEKDKAPPVAGNEKDKASMLADAVKEFNQRAQKNGIGNDQPALTEDEVVAAIRGWDRTRIPATDEVYQIYQTIADTHTLPDGAKLRFTTGWSGFNNHEFDVWWIDLDIKTGIVTRYTFRIRDQKLRCRPLAP